MSGHINRCEKYYYNFQTRQFESNKSNKNAKLWWSEYHHWLMIMVYGNAFINALKLVLGVFTTKFHVRSRPIIV